MKKLDSRKGKPLERVLKLLAAYVVLQATTRGSMDQRYVFVCILATLNLIFRKHDTQPWMYDRVTGGMKDQRVHLTLVGQLKTLR